MELSGSLVRVGSRLCAVDVDFPVSAKIYSVEPRNGVIGQETRGFQLVPSRAPSEIVSTVDRRASRGCLRRGR